MKSRILFLILFTFVLQLTYAVDKVKETNSYDAIIKNTVAQLDYLYEFNSSNEEEFKSDNNWYLYIVGAPLDSLKYYITETKDSFTADYLKELNENLKKINSYSSTAVYVAFTDYDSGYLSPIIPSVLKTITEQEQYIKDLIKANDSSKYTQNQLAQFEIEIAKYRKAFRALIKSIYNKSRLSKIEKPNLLMPFSNYFLRKEIQDKNGENYLVNRFQSFTVHTPKLEKGFSRAKLKAIYNETAIEESTNYTIGEQKMYRFVAAINRYFHGPEFDYKECQELIQKYKNKPIMKDFPEFAKRVAENPCILNSVVSWGEDLVNKSEWMEMTELLIVIPLYAVLAIPAASVAGADVAYVLTKELLKKKAKDAALSATYNIGTQTIMNYYFGSEAIVNEKDDEKRWDMALKEFNEFEFSKEVLKSLLDLSTREEIVIACLEEGVKIKNVNWNTYDLSNASVEIQLGGCIKNTIKYILVDKVLEQSFGYLLKKLKPLAQKDPKLFVKAWRKLKEDLPDFRKDLTKGYQAYTKDLLEASGVTALNGTITKYIDSYFSVDEAFDAAFKSYVDDIGKGLGKEFEHTLKDAAIETDVLIKEGASQLFADGVSRSITKQGANVSIDFTIEGQDVKIYATLLEELSDGSYRIVFVNTAKNVSGSVDQFLKTTTSGRKNIINALKNGSTPFTPVAKGANAGKLGIDGKTINITEVQLRTQKGDGNFNNDVIVSNKKNVVKAGDDLLKSSGKFIDDVLEADYAKYLTRKANQGKPPRDRLNWKEARDYWLNDSPLARGNNFNRKAWDEEWYPFSEVYLDNGKFLDGYNPLTKEVVSRKATDLVDIQEATFIKYLDELKVKYAPPRTIKSQKPGYESIYNQPIPNDAKLILEIPELNKTFSDIERYKQIALNKGITIKFAPE